MLKQVSSLQKKKKKRRRREIRSQNFYIVVASAQLHINRHHTLETRETIGLIDIVERGIIEFSKKHSSKDHLDGRVCSSKLTFGVEASDFFKETNSHSNILTNKKKSNILTEPRASCISVDITKRGATPIHNFMPVSLICSI